MGDTTTADMYDEDIKLIGKMWQNLQLKWYRKEANRQNLEELEKEAVDAAYKLGYTVRVHTSEKYLGIGQLTIEIVGRVPGHEFNRHGMDHEKKKYEVNKAVERKEDERIRQQIKAIE